MIIRISKFFLLILGVFISQELIGQRFTGGLVGGINISQIDGDGSAGYNKWGFTAGTKIVYEFEGRSDLSMELLYSQRGSRRPGDYLPFTIQMHYLELPVIFSYNDWYIEREGYYKVRADLGLSYGYLFNTKYTANGEIDELDDLRTNDVSYILGVAYQFNSRWAISVRYTSSINKMLEDSQLNGGGLRGYFLTTRAEYYF